MRLDVQPQLRLGELDSRQRPNSPAMADQHATFHPKDTLANTGKVTFQTGLIGAIVAATQNTLRKQNVGVMGVFTRSGGLIALYGAYTCNCSSIELGEAN